MGTQTLPQALVRPGNEIKQQQDKDILAREMVAVAETLTNSLWDQVSVTNRIPQVGGNINVLENALVF